MMDSNELTEKSGPISWMARNPVAANLLMVALILGGFMVSRQIKQEVFPEFDLDIVQIIVPYPSASLYVHLVRATHHHAAPRRIADPCCA